MTNITYKGMFSPSPLAFELCAHDDRFLLALFNLYKKQLSCIFLTIPSFGFQLDYLLSLKQITLHMAMNYSNMTKTTYELPKTVKLV